MFSFYDNGLHFSCQRCSRCCRVNPGYVYLSRSDLTNLCIWFNLNQLSFVDKYCRWVHLDEKFVLCLKEKENFDCILWKDGCTAYKNRPVQCSTYPFWEHFLQSKSIWNEQKETCPGINVGEIHLKNEIEEQLNMYTTNEPLTREDFISGLNEGEIKKC